MNEILQKRIEEAKKKIIQEYVKSFRYENGMELEPTIKIFLEKIGNVFFEHGISFALQNQWASVDEALPEEDIPNCFVAYKAMDVVLYSTGSYEKDNKEWYVDGVGFNAEVTHYMPIPSLKGDEK